eukprot:4797145-Pleurochrysis_carterae.AAC.1
MEPLRPGGAKCPSATLRHKLDPVGDAAWSVFLEYVPGRAGLNFAAPQAENLRVPFRAGMQVTCSPPFVSAGKGANLAPSPAQAVQ